MPHAITRRTALASLLLTSRAWAQDADGVDLGETQIPTAGGAVAGSFGKPPGAGPFPVVLVAEGGGGPNRVVTDACHGLAKEGFLAVAPALFGDGPPDGTVMQRLDAAVEWAAANGGDPARLGIVGFGPGGRAAWLYDSHSPALKAAVAWYGPMGGTTSPAHPTTALDAAAHLHAPLLGLYGKNDGGISRRVLLDAEARAKAAGKVAEIVQYAGAGPNFAAPGPGFDQAATLDGWQRSLAWLRRFGVT